MRFQDALSAKAPYYVVSMFSATEPEKFLILPQPKPKTVESWAAFCQQVKNLNA